jgi:hypothetical protein
VESKKLDKVWISYEFPKGAADTKPPMSAIL